jgi:hypothetical protein
MRLYQCRILPGGSEQVTECTGDLLRMPVLATSSGPDLADLFELTMGDSANLIHLNVGGLIDLMRNGCRLASVTIARLDRVTGQLWVELCGEQLAADPDEIEAAVAWGGC